ncbi:hypothetical protein H2248_008121 [Termitomyces sp. 'cryptogamus']|nr:hypothetical protein H2248_008121 [Termitomyces sp. 'cryptogamus']
MIWFTLALFSSLLTGISLVLAAPTHNYPTLVRLRIEGETNTIFDRIVLTHGHPVTASGVRHPCDGTNNHAHPFPGPTAIAALDDASRIGRFAWDGTWFPRFEDYLVTMIAGVPAVKNESDFWHLILNYRDAPAGGCQLRVRAFDEVLFAYSAANKTLKLSGPREARVGVPITLTVTDGATDAPVAGALVANETSDVNGHVSVAFFRTGSRNLKAERSDAIRSRKHLVKVRPNRWMSLWNWVELINPTLTSKLAGFNAKFLSF